ncbi:Tfp pilus assembly protein FimT/FimU [Aliikangiella sp. G2MR2-5]|uniref:pilus assembly FimT family protein n=1 Tax=Aliikangiella sp. G2MR2-5 TaxID=2788943 RepID=UPI0018AB1ABF|nr:prepilin-type N-terminal cleavage/methylation domain-containing protein [Aliikangiella sp. G2MR2-5]
MEKNFKQTLIRPSGFSLLEILIAMALIALLAGIAIPYLGGDSNKFAKKEAQRLLAAVEMARDLAIIESKEYGLNIDEEKYQFLYLNDEDDTRPPQWELLSDHPQLASHEFPETVEVNVAIDGDNVFASQDDDVEIFEEDVNIFEEEDEQEKVDPPQIYFLSTGEQNEFVIAFASVETYQSKDDEPVFFRVKGSLTGELQYQGPLPGDLFNQINEDYSDYLEQEPLAGK